MTGAALFVDGVVHLRPATRAACADGLRPCPWIACRHHLAGTERVLRAALRICKGNRRWVPDRRAWERSDISAACDDFVDALLSAPVSCALDIIDDHPGGMSDIEIGAVLGISRQRVEQEADSAARKMRTPWTRRLIT